jgi:uncharacterized protein with GYD domain
MGTSDDPEMSTPESPTIQQILFRLFGGLDNRENRAQVGRATNTKPRGMTTMLFCLTADYTPQALNAMRENPNTNRQAAVEQLLSAAGGKLVAMYGRATNGPGVMVIFDVTDPAMAPAITGVAVSAGSVQNLQLTRLFTMDEIAGIRQKAGQIRGAYKPPGQQ